MIISRAHPSFSLGKEENRLRLIEVAISYLDSEPQDQTLKFTITSEGLRLENDAEVLIEAHG